MVTYIGFEVFFRMAEKLGRVPILNELKLEKSERPGNKLKKGF